jgi:Outer membrane protein beta-barrel family/CarboxypepD_reg-like domain
LKIVAVIFFFFLPFINHAQKETVNPGIITGNLLNADGNKAIPSATIRLTNIADSLKVKNIVTDKNGSFLFTEIAYGWYRLKISAIGYNTLTIDSIHIRKERFDFNLNDIVLKTKSVELDEVIVYAEKPLIESKEGNIIFHAGESPLSAGSNASELLNNVPLVTKDPNGKILVRGKEPKILIDDKPVELNLQQLQDLLESMSGSMIEKIEVMTNPPPQYANEQGGVINIVTRKGRVGMGGRVSIYGGSRGEAGVNGSFNYRKSKLALNISAGYVFNNFKGDGNSSRQNFYTDSSNFFNTQNSFTNKNTRPSLRLNFDYEVNKQHTINLLMQLNYNDFDNENLTRFTNLNRFGNIYRLSERNIISNGLNKNQNITVTYTLRGKKPGETFKIISGYNFSDNDNGRDFFQQYFNPDKTPSGIDSTQMQDIATHNNGINLRVNYDKLLSNKKTTLSLGSYYTRSNSHVITDAHYFKKPESVFIKSNLLSNDFKFHQDVFNYRASVKQLIKGGISISAGASAEQTVINFELLKDNKEAGNRYWTLMPFANFNKLWKNRLNFTFSYRKSIRRPGIGELNPAIDFNDPYNIRFGNPYLEASTADNFDLVIGKTKEKYYLNAAIGYNNVQDIFSLLRTLLPDGKTQITWENISGRKEYELSTWNGYTVSKKLKLGMSASYTYSTYNAFDREVRKFRNGGSFTSNVNFNFNAKEIWVVTGSFTFNRFANPQGTVRNNLSMNTGVQRRLFQRKFSVTFNMIDPFIQQRNKTTTYGTNFILQSESFTQTRNFRLSIGYNFTRGTKNNFKKQAIQKAVITNDTPN